MKSEKVVYKQENESVFQIFLFWRRITRKKDSITETAIETTLSTHFLSLIHFNHTHTYTIENTKHNNFILSFDWLTDGFSRKIIVAANRKFYFCTHL